MFKVKRNCWGGEEEGKIKTLPLITSDSVRELVL